MSDMFLYEVGVEEALDWPLTMNDTLRTALTREAWLESDFTPETHTAFLTHSADKFSVLIKPKEILAQGENNETK